MEEERPRADFQPFRSRVGVLTNYWADLLGRGVRGDDGHPRYLPRFGGDGEAQRLPELGKLHTADIVAARPGYHNKPVEIGGLGRFSSIGQDQEARAIAADFPQQQYGRGALGLDLAPVVSSRE